MPETETRYGICPCQYCSRNMHYVPHNRHEDTLKRWVHTDTGEVECSDWISPYPDSQGLDGYRRAGRPSWPYIGDVWMDSRRRSYVEGEANSTLQAAVGDVVITGRMIPWRVEEVSAPYQRSVEVGFLDDFDESDRMDGLVDVHQEVRSFRRYFVKPVCPSDATSPVASP
jgi:hypothetical protein